MRRWRKCFSNKLWFTIHGWIGVQVGILLFLILFSGSLATVSHEIDWLLNPAMRIVPQEAAVSCNTILETVKRAYPQRRISFVKIPLNERFAAEIWVEQPEGGDFTETIRRVYVNPYTGKIQGVTGWFNVQRTLRNFHMSLSLPSVGIYIVGPFGLFLLSSVISALLFYKRWWQRFLVFRWNRSWRVFWSDAHRTSGLWSLWFTLIIAVTGIWYLLEMAMFDAGVGLQDVPQPPPRLNTEQLARYEADSSRLSLDALIDSVKTAYPGYRIDSIHFPADQAASVQFTGEAHAWLVRPRANRVYVNPYDGSIMALYKGEELPFAYRWVHTADPLHFGDFGGLISKLVWCLFGLLSSSLTLTGVYLHFLRHRQQARTAAVQTSQIVVNSERL